MHPTRSMESGHRIFPATLPAMDRVKTRISLDLDGFRVSQKWPQKNPVTF
jgi:hypothetical protein